MKNLWNIGWLSALVYLLAGCSLIAGNDSLPEDDLADKQGMHISKISLSPSYKYITLDLDFQRGRNLPFDYNSDTIQFNVTEMVNKEGKYVSPVKMRIKQKSSVIKEETARQNLKVLALVDLTLPQPMVDEEREALHEMKKVYSDSILFVTFMGDGELTETIPLTDYVLDNYFQSKEGTDKYLLRAIVNKRDEMLNNTVHQLSSDNMALVVFSDGKVYDENSQPIDPNYFEYKAELDQVYTQMVNDSISIYYVNMDMEADAVNSESTASLRRMCSNYDGLYQDSFDWGQLESDFQRAFRLNYCDYRLILENPDRKIYRGQPHTLFVDIVSSNQQVLATDSITYTLGSAYDPIIVRGDNTWHIIIQGFLLAVLLLAMGYIMFQFIVPYIQYYRFLEKYVVEYQGKGMSVNGQLVADSCYLCKDQFRKGDWIVAKCSHTVHKSCWDENEYRCPEYGTHCKDGIHYYNAHNLTDPKNASSFLRMLIIGVLSAFFAWLFFIPNIELFPADIVYQMTVKISGIDMNTPNADSLIAYYVHELNELAQFGLCVGFFNAFFFCMVTVRNRRPWFWFSSIFGRSIVAAVGCSFFFATEWIISLALNNNAYDFLIDWIPWTLSSILNLYLCAYHTNETLKKNSVMITCVAGVISMNIWHFIIVDTLMDYRLMLLISFLAYSIVLSICQSYKEFNSEHYFLSVSGGTKPMDVALYKWFRTAPHAIVTIGKSVDCDLQLTWEITGDISPRQVEIRMEKGVLRMFALEEGVMVKGKPWPVNKGLRLYHGTSFMIGRTTFTYKEKDIK
jgi:hypothetical protein